MAGPLQFQSFAIPIEMEVVGWSNWCGVGGGWREWVRIGLRIGCFVVVDHSGWDD